MLYVTMTFIHLQSFLRIPSYVRVVSVIRSMDFLETFSEIKLLVAMVTMTLSIVFE